MTIYVSIPEKPPMTPAAITTAHSRETKTVARALDTPRITLVVIGKAIGVSRFALLKYRNGQRPIPAARRIQLADYLEAHARQVLADADALRASPPG